MKSRIERLISFLSHLGSYSHPNSQIKIVQTHASVIAIGDEYVYKVKKPVNFEFMDFSTLEKRKFYCHEEVRLNSRLTKGIYLGVVPIYFDVEKGYSFQERGVIDDYAIKMKRMADDGFLSEIISVGSYKRPHLELIVKQLCAFYNLLGPQGLDPHYGTPESIAYIINENTQVRREFIGKTLYPLQEELISDYQQKFLVQKEDFLIQRLEEGWVRDTHGDLRLEHFYFDENGLQIFDCIEFKERLRVNDLVNDFGFLCMELDKVGMAAESDIVYDQLIECTSDHNNKDLLLFYKTHRACVRGMVHAVAAFEEEVTPEDQSHNRLTSERFFALATRYVLLRDTPSVFAVFGGVATGKSTVSEVLSRLLGIPHIQSDATRKELAGLKVDEYPDEVTREKLYTRQMTERTYREVVRKGKECIRQNRAVILDGRWSKREQKQMLREGFEGVRIFWVQTTAPFKEREKRLKERETNRSISDARLDIFKKLLKDEIYEDADSETITVDTSKTLKECVGTVFNRISESY